MTEGSATILDLPPLRGNPFDLRPIESSRAEHLVGRNPLLSKLRGYLILHTPRMVLLVGQRGSGRTSFINTLASQTSRRSYIGQFWPEAEDPTQGIIHEISVHIAGFEVAASMQLVSDRLVETLDKETGVLPLIALDYPSHIDLNSTLARLAPLLQRLRALVVVAITPSQLSSLNDDVLDLFDEPQRLSNLNEKQIQSLSNHRISKFANQKWIIKPNLLKAIHENTDGNPRRVVRLLRDLVEERRDPMAGGTLERLVTWRHAQPEDREPLSESEPETEFKAEPEAIPPSIVETEAEGDTEDEDLNEDLNEDLDEDPDDLWDDADELISEAEDEAAEIPEETADRDWNEGFGSPEKIWDEEEESAPASEVEPTLVPEAEPEPEKEPEAAAEPEREVEVMQAHSAEEPAESTSDEGETYERTETDRAFLYMEGGTEPTGRPNLSGGNFGSLLKRTMRTSDRMPTAPDDTPVTIAQSHPSLMPRAQKPAVRSMPPDSVIEEESQARIDRSIQPIEDEHVYHTDHALWVVEPGSETTLPDESAYTPPPVATISLGAEAIETEWFVAEKPESQIESKPETEVPFQSEVQEMTLPTLAPEMPTISPTVQTVPTIPTIPVGLTTSADAPAMDAPPVIPTSFEPVWEDDEPFDAMCLHTLTEAERMILTTSASREVSPSDQELQARLEVGRSRLSQIYNGMRRKGLLSVRKQGRTRFFKLSTATSQHFSGAPKGVAR